jgi:amidase
MLSFLEYAKYDGLGLADLVRRGEVTPTELKDIALKGIEELNPKINSVVNVIGDQAEQEIQAGLPEGPFTGVPFLIKEIVLHAAGVPCHIGSRLAQGLVFDYDTELMARFRKAGLVTIGVTPTPEFGYNATTEAAIYGSTRNPWNTERSSGGSSGGASASVAAGIVPLAHANDGGGSIRIPASCCGLFGLKPTRGRVPTGPDYGEILNGLAVEFAVTRSVRDAAALMDVIAGPDSGGYAYAEPPNRSYSEEISADPGRLRIAWMSQPLTGVPVDQECIESLHSTVKLCEELGHEMVEDSPRIDVKGHSLATLRVWTANLANMMDGVAGILGRRPSPENLEAANWACYEFGKAMNATELLQALDIFALVSRSVGKFFEKYDALLTPTTACPPLPLGVLNANAPFLTAEKWTEKIFAYAPFTNLYNTTGQPAMTVPLAWSMEGLPIGMMFGARFGDEATLFRLAGQFEKARPWGGKHPPVHMENI